MRIDCRYLLAFLLLSPLTHASQLRQDQSDSRQPVAASSASIARPNTPAKPDPQTVAARGGMFIYVDKNAAAVMPDKARSSSGKNRSTSLRFGDDSNPNAFVCHNEQCDEWHRRRR